MTKPLPFTKASLERAIAAARKAGLRVTAIRPDGVLLVHDGDKGSADVPGPGPAGQDVAASEWEVFRA